MTSVLGAPEGGYPSEDVEKRAPSLLPRSLRPIIGHTSCFLGGIEASYLGRWLDYRQLG